MPMDAFNHRVLLLVAVAMIATVGLCLVDAHEAMGAELCGGAGLIPAVGVLAVSPLRLLGRFVPVPVPAYAIQPSDVPAPPPKT